jgi:hypothetical protein
VAALQGPSSRLVAPLLAAIDLLTFAQPVAADNKITVTVAGTDITATLSGSGNFVLNGVPSGNVQLHFSGNGVDARLSIDGVQPEHIKIAITLNGSNASVDSLTRVQMNDAAELEGVISSVSRGDRSMRVNGIEIKIKDAPVYLGSSRVGLELLEVGQRVKVTGTWYHDYVNATTVVISGGSTPNQPPSPPVNQNPPPSQNPPPQTPPPSSGAYAVDGPIAQISPGDRSMRVNGIEVKIWDAPVYRGSQRIGISELRVGQRVGVKGNWVESKYVVATEVFAF